MTPAQVTMVRTLLSKAGVDEAEKVKIVKHITRDRTSSLKDMSYNETQDIVTYLQGVTGQKAVDRPKEKPGDDMRRKIISRAHEMHWKLSNGKVDMERVNNWCLQYSGKNKKLNHFTVAELPTLVTQFEFVYQSFLTGL